MMGGSKVGAGVGGISSGTGRGSLIKVFSQSGAVVGAGMGTGGILISLETGSRRGS